MYRKIRASLFILLVAIAGWGFCAPKEVTIKILSVKVEITEQMQQLVSEYKKVNPNVNIVYESQGAGGLDYRVVLKTRFASGDEPDVFTVEDRNQLRLWVTKLEDLSDQPWVSDIVTGADSVIKINGKIYGMPMVMEGLGIACNKKLFKQIGISEIPKIITLSQLKDICAKFKKKNIVPFAHDFGDGWPQAHLFATVVFGKVPDIDAYVKDVARGKIDLKTDKYMVGLLDYIDLVIQNGRPYPATADYNTALTQFASEQSPMIQQGVWIQPEIDKINPGLDLAFMPIPSSDNPEDSLCIDSTQYWIINKDSKVKKEAKEFFQWYWRSDTGRHYMVDVLKFIPPFKSVKAEFTSPLNKSLNNYLKAGKTYYWGLTSWPPACTEPIQDALVKYVSGDYNRERFYKAIKEAFQASEKAM